MRPAAGERGEELWNRLERHDPSAIADVAHGVAEFALVRADIEDAVDLEHGEQEAEMSGQRRRGVRTAGATDVVSAAKSEPPQGAFDPSRQSVGSSAHYLALHGIALRPLRLRRRTKPRLLYRATRLQAAKSFGQECRIREPFQGRFNSRHSGIAQTCGAAPEPLEARRSRPARGTGCRRSTPSRSTHP